MELIYDFSALSMALIMFFMKFTSPNIWVELTAKLLGKIVPLFVMGYAIVKIFKYFGII